MRIQNCLFSLMLIGASAQGEVSDAYRGDWLLVNGAVVLHVDGDGTMTLRNSGDKGRLTLNKDGTFTWELTGHPRSGRFSDGRLLLKSEEEGAPKWMAYLEFRRGEKELADELIQFTTRQQTEAAAKVATARRKYIEIAILNNLRQLDGAAIQFCLENRVKTVKLDQLVGPGKILKQLKPVDGEDYSKLDLTDGVTPWKIVSASGVTVTFDR